MAHLKVCRNMYYQLTDKRNQYIHRLRNTRGHIRLGFYHIHKIDRVRCLRSGACASCIGWHKEIQMIIWRKVCILK